MPETGAAWSEIYATAYSDVRRMVESVLREESARQGPYIGATSRTILGPPARASRDFSYAGERLGINGKQLLAARRFSGTFDFCVAQLEEAVASRELMLHQPAVWLDFHRTLESAKIFVQSGIVSLKIQGSTERGASPLIVQSDVFGHLARLGTTKEEQLEEARRLQLVAAEGQEQQGEAKETRWARIRRSLSAQPPPAPYPLTPTR